MCSRGPRRLQYCSAGSSRAVAHATESVKIIWHDVWMTAQRALTRELRAAAAPSTTLHERRMSTASRQPAQHTHQHVHVPFMYASAMQYDSIAARYTGTATRSSDSRPLRTEGIWSSAKNKP